MDCKRCHLIRWGKHPGGSQRWRCTKCGKSKVRQRRGFPHRLLKRYLLDGDTCDQLAVQYRLHPNTIRNRLAKILERTPPALPVPSDRRPYWLVTDATHFKRWGCLFVTKTTNQPQPIAVSFHERECYQTALDHLKPLSSLTVSGYTVDGKKGLVLAYQQLFPDAKLQRCLVHIQMRVQSLLTCNPRLPAGQELLGIVRRLVHVKRTDGAQNWWQRFTDWQERWQPVLNERTYREDSPWLPGLPGKRRRRWWYTQRNLRYAWRHVLHAADYLFVFLDYPQAVSHTNHLEGLFGQRKPSLYRHRGLSRKRVAKTLLWTFSLLNNR